MDLETARTENSKAGAGVIQRYEVGHTMASTNAEFIGATFSLLVTEANARLLTLAESGALDSREAEAMVSCEVTLAIRRSINRPPGWAIEWIDPGGGVVTVTGADRAV